MAQASADQHQGTLTVRESPNRFCMALDFPVNPFCCVVGSDPVPVFGWIVHVCERLFDAFFNFVCSLGKLHFTELFSNSVCFGACRLFAFLRMYCFQHHRDSSHLGSWRDSEYISVEMYSASLIACIRKNFRDAFQHAEAFVSNDEANALQTSFFEPDKEVFPAFMILFHAFSGAENLAETFIVYADCHKDGYILDFSAPTAFKVYSIYINVGVFFGNRA